jgi:hypothetical protein
MAGLVTFGIAQGADGHEVAQRAVQQALTGLGAAKPVFGLVFVPQAFEIKGTLAGLTGSLGNTPLWGFNTSETISSAGVSPNHLVIAIFAGSDWKVEMAWLPEFSQNPAAAGKQIRAALEKNPGWKNVLIAADGLNGDLEMFDSVLETGPWGIAGGLAGGVRLLLCSAENCEWGSVGGMDGAKQVYFFA